MKNKLILTTTIISCLFLVACSPPENTLIDEILQTEEIINDSVDLNSIMVSEDFNVSIVDENRNIIEINPENTTSNSEVDFDFTTMSSTMVYAQVYDLMSNSDSYFGKSFRMVGEYNQTLDSYDELMHFIIINDATGCCPQGLELKFPEDMEIPVAGTAVIVDATVDTYEFDGFNYAYMNVSSIEITN